MSKVKLLPEEIISKIAAGEVIDRPAAVIKELVENSLDAGATSVEITLNDAGKNLITVKDNGSGILKDDLENIFLRHATSKIQSVEDLDKIASLGFRGEALYSIGAIADVIVKSKTENEPAGWEIHLRAGKKLELAPCSLGFRGTEIQVRELFFNTPARKKFLKSNSTEINQILNIFIPYTILYPHCRFKLSHEGKDLIDLFPTEDRADRVAEVLNVERKYLKSLNEQDLNKQFNCEFILGDINIQRPRRDLQFIFVNNRPVQNKNISFHLNQIYRLIMPEGLNPAFVVMLTLPLSDVDVNIHPTKREVKIKDDTSVGSFLRKACERSLLGHGGLKEVRDSWQEQSHIERALTKSSPFETAMRDSLPAEIFESSSDTKIPLSSDDYAFPQSGRQDPQEFFIPKDFFNAGKIATIQSKLENAHFIGIFMTKFILFESGTTLLIIDQHAAAERITFEHLVNQMQKSQVEIQRLLAPTVLKLSPQEFLVWEDTKDLIEKSGFESTQLDDETIAVHSHPNLIEDIEYAIRLMLAGETIEKNDFAALARRACRSSIMAGERLPKEKAEFLREQLLQCLDPFTCPHGRPTIIELKEDFLDKQFLRC